MEVVRPKCLRDIRKLLRKLSTRWGFLSTRIKGKNDKHLLLVESFLLFRSSSVQFSSVSDGISVFLMGFKELGGSSDKCFGHCGSEPDRVGGRRRMGGGIIDNFMIHD